MRNKLFNAAFIVVIVAVGLVAAYILFAVLDSEASGEFQGYSVTGAVAGFVVVELLLFSTYLQLRKSDNEDLQEQINQLQQKLIRGAPRPRNFESEVAERERIVLARPREWKPGAGIIFDFQPPREETHSNYHLSPEFRCSYAPIAEEVSPIKARIFWRRNSSVGPSTLDLRKQFYDNYRQDRLEKGRRRFFYESYACEYDYIGGEPEPVESLRVIINEYAEVVPRDPDPTTKTRQPPRWRSVTKQRYEELPKIEIARSDSRLESLLAKSPIRVGKPVDVAATESGTQVLTSSNGESDDLIPRSQVDATDVAPSSHPARGARVTHALVVTYHEQLGKIYYFDFWAAPSDFVEKSAKFNQILNSVRFLS